MSSTTDAVSPDDLKRDAKALTEPMTVDRHTGLTGRYHVYSDATGQYCVDLVAGTCDCPDALHRGVRCKHYRRVEFSTGARDLPEWVDHDDAIDPTLVRQREVFGDE